MYSWCPWSLGSSRRSFAPETGKGRISKLKRLNYTRYHDRPVSLCRGMVDLPLIVTRPEGVSWFQDRDLLTGEQEWAERESGSSPRRFGLTRETSREDVTSMDRMTTRRITPHPGVLRGLTWYGRPDA